MAGRGQQATPEQVTALRNAQRAIDGYRGSADIGEQAAAFAREATRDALHAAPQPVTGSWVLGALSITAGLAQWCENIGQPMDRDHVLAQQTRHRYLFGGGATVLKISRSTYWSRLDVVATALLAPPARPRPSVTGLKAHINAPLSDNEQIDLWAWARGMHPPYRRHRLMTVMALTLGAGARPKDLMDLPVANITRDEHGIHVGYQTADSPRLVTCRADWEDRLWEQVVNLDPQVQTVGYRQPEPIDSDALDHMVWSARNVSPPPVHFTMRNLRHSWLVYHLHAGTPLAVLLPASDIVEAITLVKLLKYVPAPSAEERTIALRQVGA